MQNTRCNRLVLAPLLVIGLLSMIYAGHAQTKAPGSPDQKTVPPGKKPGKPVIEGTMTIQSMDRIVKLLDKSVQSARPGIWQFKVEKAPVIIVTDVKANRMRIMVPIRKAKGLTAAELTRISQANFDTALDSRYAIAQKLLWAVYIHPLTELHQRQFIKGIGQTVNLALTYGKTYSSGLLSYGGGDSRGIIQRQLIDKLLKKGIPI